MAFYDPRLTFAESVHHIPDGIVIMYKQWVLRLIASDNVYTQVCLTTPRIGIRGEKYSYKKTVALPPGIALKRGFDLIDEANIRISGRARITALLDQKYDAPS